MFSVVCPSVNRLTAFQEVKKNGRRRLEALGGVLLVLFRVEFWCNIAIAMKSKVQLALVALDLDGFKSQDKAEINRLFSFSLAQVSDKIQV